MTAVQVLGLIGALLIIGFLADYLFKKINLPDILILLALGYLIGPVLNIVNPTQIAPASQTIASLALVIILFSGGLEFEFSRVLRSAPRTTVLVLLGVAVSIASIAAFTYYLLHWDILDSLLLGAIVGGTSSAIVIPLVCRDTIPIEVSSLLSLESALNSPLVIVIALVVLEIMSSGQTGVEILAVAQAIGIRFIVGITFGTAVGFFWLWLLTRMEKEAYSDMLTLAVVLFVYFIVEGMHGSGVIFALIFGIILGNSTSVARLLRIKQTFESTEIMKRFHSQIFFFIKTFFFIYLGLTITFGEPGFAILGIILSFILLFTRYIAVLLTSVGNSTLLSNQGVLTTTLARGESAAVLAQIVVASKIQNASLYPDTIMAIIATTILISAIGIPIFARRPPAIRIEA